VIKCLVSVGANVNEKDHCGRILLHTAARSYSVEIVQCLVSAGADIGAKDDNGLTPLHYAASSSTDIGVLEYLVTQGASVNMKARFGVTPLHHAAMLNSDVAILRYLISTGANVHAKATGDFTPLDVANTNEKKDILREAMTRIDIPTEPQSSDCEFTHQNRENERMKFIEYILVDAISPVIKATDKEGVIREMVQSLLDAGGIKTEEYEGIVKSLIKREELGSTGIGRGVAVPHIKHPSVKRNVGAVAICTEGIDFDCLDDKKAHLFFLVISPPDRPGDHLRVMEHLTRRLKDDTLHCFLQLSKTREAIFALLEEADRNH
jgi:PTS system fructose-specific IIA component/PTS system nitrogen regulatory IIA component